MKSSNKPQTTTRLSRFSKISQRHGLIVVVLVAASLILQSVNPVLSGVVSVASFMALIFAFISGYKRSDELEQLVQLKAATISFIVVMFITFALSVLSSLDYKTFEGTLGIILAVGFLLQLFLLPLISKRTYEK